MNTFTDIQINDSVREKLLLAMMLQAPSGAGKTAGALILAFGMMKAKYPELDDAALWQKVGLIDTEHRRSLIYVNMVIGETKIGVFKHVPMQAPYTIERMSYAVGLVKQVGCEVCIVDSSSHMWEGEGGVLDYQQDLGGRFQDWRTANKEAYDPMVALMTGETHQIHMINTSRTKQEHAMITGEDGKTKVAKLGMKPIQRDSLEYEFQIVLNIDMDHKATPSKDNSQMFKGQRFEVTPEHGKMLHDWLEEGKDIFAEREAEARKAEEQRVGIAKEMRMLAVEWGLEAWIAGMEKNPYFNAPLEQLDYERLMRFRQGMQQQIELREKAAHEKQQAQV